MKLALYSDLHLEIASWDPPALDVDVVILAGDIGSHTQGIDWAASAFRQCPVSPEIIYVAGNHEFYGARIQDLTTEMRKTSAKLGINFLENNAIEIDGVRFLGTALWSDFQLYSGTSNSMRAARNQINDYSTILGADRKFIKPLDTIRLHHDARAFLAHELAKPFAGKTVVVTHFSPHRSCVEPRFEGTALTPYFTSDMSPLIRQHPIALWAFGHTHYNVDFVDHGCRVVSNQRGYPREQSRDFRPDLVIEV